MTDGTAAGRDRRALQSVATQFFVNGAVFASISPRLPEIRTRIDVTTGTLGVLLARRLDLLRTRAFWTPALLVVLLCDPWYALTTGYQASSWDGGASPHWGYTRAATPIYLSGLVQDLGGAGVAGMGTFGLGFNVLPMVFASMPYGALFGGLFFFLLFLAAVTSSLSMLQPGIAFLEEALRLNRKQSVALLGMITAVGCAFVVYFSYEVKALDTLDFWVGTFLIFVLSTIQIIIFGWIVGIEKGFAMAHEGAALRIPGIYKFIMKYVSPLLLIAIFIMWLATNIFGLNFSTGEAGYSNYVKDLFIEPNLVAWFSILLIGLVAAFFAFCVALNPAYKTANQKD